MTHVCDVEFQDEEWVAIEDAARRENLTPEEWIIVALKRSLDRV